MQKNIREIASWLLEQGREITREVLEEKLEEAYRQGWADARSEGTDAALADILNNATLEIKQRMQTLYERNFYNVPSPEDQNEMRAYEFLLENLPQIIREYQKAPAIAPCRAARGGRG